MINNKQNKANAAKPTFSFLRGSRSQTLHESINILRIVFFFCAASRGLLLRGIPWITFSFLLYTLNFLLVSCQTTEPPVTQGKIILEALDASSTEAWLKLSLQELNLPQNITVTRNDTIIETLTMDKPDTVIYDEGLLPAKTYKYKATITLTESGGQSNNQAIISSAEVMVTTMDTTSHDFTWETFTFGGVNGSSVLRDVAIINENDIWAVGEIHTADTDQFDSNGVWVQPYNAVHWDGNKWELKRIMFYIDQDQPSAGKTSSPCEASFVFNDNKIAITSNVQTAIFNTNGEYSLIKMGFAWVDRFTINALWGTSSTDFYIAGNNGNIAHYDGNRWEKIESPAGSGTSGTDLDIYDIWGNYDKKNNEYEILAVASKILQSADRDILRITNTGVEKLVETGIDWPLHGIWFKSGRKYYAVGSGIYRKNKLSDKQWNNRWQPITPYFIYAVRGKDINDIFMCGAFGEVLHYNGKSWYSFLNKELQYFNGSMVKLSYKNNTVCIVGSDGRFGIIYLGKRN